MKVNNGEYVLQYDVWLKYSKITTISVQVQVQINMKCQDVDDVLSNFHLSVELKSLSTLHHIVKLLSKLMISVTELQIVQQCANVNNGGKIAEHDEDHNNNSNRVATQIKLW